MSLNDTCMISKKMMICTSFRAHFFGMLGKTFNASSVPIIEPNAKGMAYLHGKYPV
jgi:hypothetical protein